ncbi:MAG TPA: hypothetical protein VF629_23830 [Hymenobacter sp.]|jgi:hypothetical protein|uniref:hypothetical protein n=1 Tax=Hymenobacter sp. TaxID=1898978 RepID=UPI002ED7EB23
MDIYNADLFLPFEELKINTIMLRAALSMTGFAAFSNYLYRLKDCSLKLQTWGAN